MLNVRFRYKFGERLDGPSTYAAAAIERILKTPSDNYRQCGGSSWVNVDTTLAHKLTIRIVLNIQIVGAYNA